MRFSSFAAMWGLSDCAISIMHPEEFLLLQPENQTRPSFCAAFLLTPFHACNWEIAAFQLFYGAHGTRPRLAQKSNEDESTLLLLMSTRVIYKMMRFSQEEAKLALVCYLDEREGYLKSI
jgi:hypothetical protein